MKPDALPDDLRDLLQAEKSAPPPPDAVKARVLARVETTMAATAAGMGIKLVLALVAVSTVAGGVWLGGVWTAIREPEVAAKSPPAPRQEPPIQNTEGANKTLAVDPVKTAPNKRVVTARTEIAPRPVPALIEPPETPLPKTLLAEERVLLDSARASVQRQDVIAARVALRKHEREFARGQLEEERDLLWVLVLGLERDPSMEVRAAAFKARYPSSLFTRAVDDAVRRMQTHEK